MHSETADAAAVLDTVIRSRKSIRAFRPEPVPKQQLMEILETARAAPSNFNSQPWRVYLLTGRGQACAGRRDPAGACDEDRTAILALSPTESSGMRRAGGRVRAAPLLVGGRRSRGHGGRVRAKPAVTSFSSMRP